MPTNKNAYIRYQALDKCFRDSLHRYYLEDLIDKCEEALLYYNGVGGVSRRQIFEDIKFMESDTGWNIPLDRIKEGKKVYYRYHYPGFSINKQPLTDEEAQQLRTVIITLSRFRGLPTNEWVEDVISSLEWRFKLRGRSENIIGFEQNEQLKGLNWLSKIIDAASNHQVVKVTYRNYKNSEVETTNIVHPWYVKQYNNRWFLFGYEEETGKIANKALDRIQRISLANIPFKPNTTIDFAHFFDDVVGVSIPYDDVEKETITLRFTQTRYPYVTSKPIHKSQATVNEKECTVSLSVKPTRELEQQILSYGSDVEVLSPESFRLQIAEKIADNYKKYFPVQNDCILNI